MFFSLPQTLLLLFDASLPHRNGDSRDSGVALGDFMLEVNNFLLKHLIDANLAMVPRDQQFVARLIRNSHNRTYLISKGTYFLLIRSTRGRDGFMLDGGAIQGVLTFILHRSRLGLKLPALGL